MDPPWQTTENEANTLTNQEILNIPLEKLSRGGFCFLWILNHNTNAGYECLGKWGYDIVDRLVWIKTLNGEKKVEIGPGRFFMRSSVMCLIGYKSPSSDRVEFRSKIANDIIVSDIKKNSQKPDQLYTIIDLMMPGSRKVEIFAKNNNLKSGWLSLGNEIGERFLDFPRFTCVKCKNEIKETRFKDLKTCQSFCTQCKTAANPNLVHLEISNNMHSYQSCTNCRRIIIGIRYQCTACDNCNLCEGNGKVGCFDQKTTCLDHSFKAYSFQQPSRILPVNEGKECIKCMQKPILGPCIVCNDCSNLTLCKAYSGQSCFFNFKFREFDEVPGHDSKHRLEILTHSSRVFKHSTCNMCGRSPLVSPKYHCNQCFNFELCEYCYIVKDKKEVKDTAHNAMHTYTFY